ncbi:MAG: DUF1127 domain-containing protein [Kiloniellales bacterium]
MHTIYAASRLPRSARARHWSKLNFGPRFGGTLGSLLEVFLIWQERGVQRRALARLDDRMLKDIGLSHVDAVRETRKPFWRP